MKKNIALPFLCSLLIHLNCFASENLPEQTSAEEKVIQYMTAQLKAFPQEKIYLHHDKPYYSAGDTIWIRAYMVHAALHQPMNYSRYIYVELVNDNKQVVSRIKIRPEEGLYYSQIPLKADIAAGKYHLRAYTNYMRNLEEDYFFHKEIYIGNLITPEAETSPGEAYTPMQAAAAKNKEQTSQGNRQQYDIQFFPEGGHLISGNMQTIAFKAIDSEGWGTDVHGRILKNGTDEVCTFNSTHLGMGYFGLYTEPGCRYTAECQNQAGEILNIELPQATDSCYALSVTQMPDKLHLSILRPYNNPLQEELSIIVHMRGLPLFKSRVSAGTDLLSLPKSALGSGVLHILLLNARFFLGLHKKDRAVGKFKSIKTKTSSYIRHRSVVIAVFAVQAENIYIGQTSAKGVTLNLSTQGRSYFHFVAIGQIQFAFDDFRYLVASPTLSHHQDIELRVRCFVFR